MRWRRVSLVHAFAQEPVPLRRFNQPLQFAHLMIGLCRSVKIPARYTSGYSRGPAPPARMMPFICHGLKVFPRKEKPKFADRKSSPIS
jgi:transglutaminase-like putative cysteine protease